MTELLADHTTLRVGGPARRWVEATTTDELVAAVSGAPAGSRVRWRRDGAVKSWIYDASVRALADGRDMGEGAIARADEGRAGPQSSPDGGRTTRESVAERQARLAMPKGRNFH